MQAEVVAIAELVFAVEQLRPDATKARIVEEQAPQFSFLPGAQQACLARYRWRSKVRWGTQMWSPPALASALLSPPLCSLQQLAKAMHSPQAHQMQTPPAVGVELTHLFLP